MLDKSMPPVRRAFAQLLLTLLVIVAADVLFYVPTAGVSLAIFSVVLLALVFSQGSRVSRHKGTWVLAVALLALAGAMVVDVSPIAVVLSVVGMVTLAIVNKQGWVTRPLRWVHRWLDFAMRSVFQPLIDLVRYLRSLTRHRGGRSGRGGRVILNWLVPIALTLVFAGLFLLANPVLAKWFESLGQWLEDAEYWLRKIPDRRVMLWCVTAVAAWALIRVRARSKSKPATKPTFTAQQVSSAEAALLNPGIAVRCLLLFNALFAVQTVMDAMYLLGGATLPDNLTYAAYAHRGAYPLVATALLAAAFIIVVFRSGGPAERSPWARRLVYLWIAQNIALTATAMWRLHLYIEVFTLSRMRVAAAVWLVLVIVGLVLILVRILSKHTNQWLICANMLSVVTVLFALAWVDIDASIAWYNVRNCREVGGSGVPIDTKYLHKLGPEALPAIDWLATQTSDGTVKQSLITSQVALRRQLHKDLDQWQGWTLRRHWLAEKPQPYEALTQR